MAHSLRSKQNKKTTDQWIIFERKEKIRSALLPTDRSWSRSSMMWCWARATAATRRSEIATRRGIGGIFMIKLYCWLTDCVWHSFRYSMKSMRTTTYLVHCTRLSLLIFKLLFFWVFFGFFFYFQLKNLSPFRDQSRVDAFSDTIHWFSAAAAAHVLHTSTFQIMIIIITASSNDDAMNINAQVPF